MTIDALPRGRRRIFAVTVLALASWASPPGDAPADPAAVFLQVPVVRQERERCGPAALRMVLEYYGAADASLADAAYDPVLHGALLTDLEACARRAGFAARVSEGDADSLTVWLARGIPPIALVAEGPGPLARAHYLVVTGWDPGRDAFRVNDGRAAPRVLGCRALEHRRARYDGKVLLVMPGVARGANPDAP